MNSHDLTNPVSPSAVGSDATDVSIPQLVGKVYDAAPVTERCRMLEHLMKPLSALALVGVCNGIFAKIWFRSGWHDLNIRPEDAQAVQGIDVASLADFVQQVNANTIHGLTALIARSPLMAYSAAAVMLVTLLSRRRK
jgi:hypothetical protein